MDPNPLRHLEYFAVPNNQTVNAVDQNFNLAGNTPSTQSPSIWDSITLPTEPGASGSPSTAPTNFSLDAFAQPPGSAGFAGMQLGEGSSSRQQMYGQQQSRPMLQGRASRSREGHERKRSKLSSDTTPFDNIDYWIQFDNDEQLGSIPERPEPLRPDAARLESRAPARTPTTQRSVSSTVPPISSAATRLGPPAQKVEEFVDDSALDNALSEEDEGFSSINLAEHLSKIDSMPPSEVPPREGLYSTPLSWEKPQPGLRLEALIGLNSPMLNEAEQRRLIAIAMNPGPSMGGLGSNMINPNSLGANSLGANSLGANFGLGLTLGSDFGTASMSQIMGQTPQDRQAAQNMNWPPSPTATTQQKRPGSISANEKLKEKEKEKQKTGDRTAHNDIERKYRTNLKDKIAELRDAVPALQTISEQDGDDMGSQPARTPKVSKGTVLTKATEYIHYLERKNRQIVQEHRELSRRLQAFEQLLNATARPSFQIPYSKTLFDPRGFC